MLHFNCVTVLPHRCVQQQAGQMLDRAKLKLEGRKKVDLRWSIAVLRCPPVVPEFGATFLLRRS